MSANVTDAIDNLAAVFQTMNVLYTLFLVLFLMAILVLISVWFTYTMFHSKNMMMGFPSAMFWAFVGGSSYIVSEIFEWADIPVWDGWWLLFAFACFGMVVFCVMAMYGLRTKKEELKEGDEYIDEGKDDITFIDEKGQSGKDNNDDEDSPRARARKRKKQKNGA